MKETFSPFKTHIIKPCLIINHWHMNLKQSIRQYVIIKLNELVANTDPKKEQNVAKIRSNREY